MNSSFTRRILLSGVILAGLLSGAAVAVRQPAERAIEPLLFRKAELGVQGETRKASQAGEAVDAGALASLGVSADAAYVDLATGRFATLRMGTPLVPGRGVGNHLAWVGPAPGDAKALEQEVGLAFDGYLKDHAAALRIDPAELVTPALVTATSDEFVRIWIQRQIDGVLVRGSSIVASVKYGNLILLGLEGWGDVDRSASEVSLDPLEAEQALQGYLGQNAAVGRTAKGTHLEWVPITENDEVTYRLAWVFENDLGEPGARYEAVVDAATGEVLSLQDLVQWATRREIKGGVYPVSNDQAPPDGVEQTGWPMPYTTVTTGSGPVGTDIGGNLCADGSITASLTGPFIRTADVCGASSLSGGGSLDWGSGPLPTSTDCTTPGIGGAGNTKSSRSGFHELNMIKEMARPYLPGNTWLAQQLTANMNVNAACNANWTGSVVNFFRSSLVNGCANTGEIAAIFDHEWGHGIDDNDAVPSIASPGEAIADVYASLRLDTSCIGRGFIIGGNCSGYGDACLSCSGVRDIDFANHASGARALIAGTGGQMNNCPATGSRGPCNKETHCEGMAPAEAVWDLWNRELTSAPYNFSVDKAREIGTQLTYHGPTAATAWYTCDTVAPFDGGCGATMSYHQYLVADDDNGNLADGTPHWGAIKDAFGLHRVGCDSDTAIDFGCAGAPTAVPSVTATPRNSGVDLSWGAIGGAASYRIYRTDGVNGCNFGKILIGEVTGTTFKDRGLQNGRQYSYLVMPMGTADECFGTPSSCTPATPAAGGGLQTLSAAAAFSDYGDNDAFLDNCELGRVIFPVANNGTVNLTNVRIVSASSPSHPSTVIAETLPKTIAAGLSTCNSAFGQVDFLPPNTLTPGATFQLQVEVTADELGGATEVVLVSTTFTEGSFQFQASKTYSYEPDAEGWQTLQGTFVRASSIVGPPGGGTFYFQSSANLGDQCDVVRSPLVRLSSTSTMSLFNHYNIEAFSDQWYDRANVGVVDAATGLRTAINPDSGRLYNASGSGGSCGMDTQPGWAGNFSSWASSGWTSAAMQTGTFAGKPAYLEVRYGTDPLEHPDGFRFDLVTVTNFDLAVADTQPDVCGASGYIFADAFEVGTTIEWTLTTP